MACGSFVWKIVVCLLLAVFAGGCAAHRVSAGPSGRPQQAATDERLEHPTDHVHERSRTAQSRRIFSPDALERTDETLRTALQRVQSDPTAVHYRQLAEAYVRRGVLDAAFDHFTLALRRRRHDPRALDGRARVWRDWGFPHLGLADVHRAIFYAPRSPGAYNTLGTILLKLGLAMEARAAFARALSLDPDATYAINNLCYTELLQGLAQQAIGTCRRALERQPRLTLVRNNLGLAYAATGDLESAAREFSHESHPSVASYNVGVVLLATGRYTDAGHAFVHAASLRPGLPGALQRAAEARRLSGREAEEERLNAHR